MVEFERTIPNVGINEKLSFSKKAVVGEFKTLGVNVWKDVNEVGPDEVNEGKKDDNVDGLFEGEFEENLDGAIVG